MNPTHAPEQRAQAGHTSLPWEVGGPYPAVSVVVCVAGSGVDEPPIYEPVCILDNKATGEPNPQALADAALIVRAVNSHEALVEALKAVAKQLECPCRNTTETSYRRDGSVIISSDVRDQLRKALALAEGGAS